MLNARIAVFLFFVLTACTNANIEIGLSSQKNSSSSSTISVSDQTFPEYGVASVKVFLSKASSTDVSFSYYTQNVTAIDGNDYFGVSGTATIPAGSTSYLVPVPISDNNSASGSKNFLFNLSSTTAQMGSSSAQLTIQDEDSSPLNLSQISVGFAHSCAVMLDSRITCWGQNTYGQLGNGTTTDSWTPVYVSGISNAQKVSTGQDFSCALLATGSVKCWGMGTSGQLGQGATASSTTPVNVGALSGVVDIAAGQSHACANTPGSVSCWGSNSNGQLGDGTTTNRSSPVTASGIASPTQVTAGDTHSCAVNATGAAYCWGLNTNGQLGDNSTTQRSTPVTVYLLSNAQKISAGSRHTCALITGGALKCWGHNANGQLGTGSFTPIQSIAFVSVSGLSANVASVDAGGDSTCVVMSDSSVKCWGGNFNGQVGDGTTSNRSSPMAVSTLSMSASNISVGNSAACAQNSALNWAQCWGDNYYGQLSTKNLNSLQIPTDVTGITAGIVTASGGTTHSCAVHSSGGMKCWGGNGSGQLGNNITESSAVPVIPMGLTTVADVAVGDMHSCAVDSGQVKCWGNGASGQIGDNTASNRLIPTLASGISSAQTVTVGYAHSCALELGSVKCWGANGTFNQVGDGTAIQRNTPVTTIASGAFAISSRGWHTCALLTGGQVQCWGNNTNGQLGDGTTTTRSVPTVVPSLISGVQQISSGYSHTCVVMNLGNIKCWGDNLNGQIGDGTTTQRLVPTDVPGLSNVISVVAGNYSTCALFAAGNVKCWGKNSNGQLGNGSLIDSNTPVQVLGLESGVAKVIAGNYHYCAILKSGGLKCWGDDSSIQLAPKYNDRIPSFVVQ